MQCNVQSEKVNLEIQVLGYHRIYIYQIEVANWCVSTCYSMINQYEEKFTGAKF